MSDQSQKEISYTVYENATPGGFVLTEGKTVIPATQDAQRYVESMFPGRGVITNLVRYL